MEDGYSQSICSGWSGRSLQGWQGQIFDGKADVASLGVVLKPKSDKVRQTDCRVEI